MNMHTVSLWRPKCVQQTLLQAPALSIGTLEGDVVTQILMPKRMLIARIQAVVADFFRIPEEEMVSQRRSRYVARPRQVAMYLSRELTPKSLPDIGRFFGGRDHTTVMHAIRQIEKFCETDEDLRADVQLLRERLTA